MLAEAPKAAQRGSGCGRRRPRVGVQGQHRRLDQSFSDGDGSGNQPVLLGGAEVRRVRGLDQPSDRHIQQRLHDLDVLRSHAAGEYVQHPGPDVLPPRAYPSASNGSGPSLQLVKKYWTFSATKTPLPVVSMNGPPLDTGAIKYEVLFVNVTQSGVTGGDWFEVPYTGSTPPMSHRPITRALRKLFRIPASH